MDEPLQIAFEPDNDAVGLALTDTMALLLFLQPVAVIVSVKVYVVVAVGLTDGFADVEVYPLGLETQLYVWPVTDAAPIETLPPAHND